MTDILEKTDLLEFEKRIFSYLETITSEPMKQWFSMEDLSKLRQCSMSELYKNPEILPHYGIPEDRWGRSPMWSRETVKSWLLRTRKELEILADARTPDQIEKAEILRAAGSVRNGNMTLVQ